MFDKFINYCKDEDGMNAWTDKIFLIVGFVLVGLFLLNWAWGYFHEKLTHGNDVTIDEYRKAGNR